MLSTFSFYIAMPLSLPWLQLGLTQIDQRTAAETTNEKDDITDTNRLFKQQYTEAKFSQ